MTDITELAQSLKAAAEKATPGNWRAFQYHDGRCGVGGGNHDEIMVCEHISKKRPHDALFIAMANPTNVLALVEALEKAQQRITQMESRTVTDWIEHDGKWRPESLGLDELVYLKTRKQELKIPYPAGKVKGWMNTGGDMDVMAYKLASPQASTVTVKLTDINEYLAEVHDKTLNRALRLLAEGVRAGDVAAMRAAGIKVEDE
ncbi:ead/Ea22-like family protein [Klebsiella pneumoniae]|uniref:ead/Ea22-like family protein n=1 Tax=Klebsiella pneumoniae TaxID=573 RepID=UPI0028F8BA4C|nr:ead/Ea22-like family protein [Klebsiella pneumoniae]MDU0017876.1 ead/Ea22-like family protein [Klebsiella pneumoniae]